MFYLQEITIETLVSALKSCSSARGVVVTGFPRSMKQVEEYQRCVSYYPFCKCELPPLGYLWVNSLNECESCLPWGKWVTSLNMSYVPWWLWVTFLEHELRSLIMWVTYLEHELRSLMIVSYLSWTWVTFLDNVSYLSWTWVTFLDDCESPSLNMSYSPW